MTNPLPTGTEVHIESSSSSGSQSVTVPADCEAVLCMCSYWDGDANFATLTLGGDSFTLGNVQTSFSSVQSNLWWLKSPSTGSQTFAWSWDSGVVEEGAHIYLVFIKNVTSDANILTDADGRTNNTAGATTPSMTTTANDTTFGVGSANGTDARINVDGQTEIRFDTAFNSNSGCIGYEVQTGTSTTMRMTGDFGAISACSVAGSTGGAGRTTYNTDSLGLGIAAGISRRVKIGTL